MPKHHRAGIPHSIQYRKLEKILTHGGARMIRTRGSHHEWVLDDVPGHDHPVGFTIAAHGGHFEIDKVYIQHLREAWCLTVNDGVSDDDFMLSKWDRTPSE